MTFAPSAVRPLATADLAACLELAVDRGWPGEESKWALLLEAGQGFGVEAPDGGLAASVILTPVGDDLAAISMVLVAARFERQGLGKRVMARAMTAAGDRTLFLISTKFGRPLYESLGFVLAGEVQCFRGVLTTNGPVARPIAGDDLAAIHKLDTEVYGTDRRALLSRLLTEAEHVHVVSREGRVTGYAFGTRYPDETVIGPVVAGDEEEAKALIGGVAAESGTNLRVDIDTRASGLLAWARAGGLVPRDPAPRMVHGGRTLPGDASRRFAPAMQALG
ncbi:GNAT family N-acetyltransferase [Amycolatopsis sp. H20-H5]|uniref:GNAT family N-acetyltransferase n=1 Tax=Amycolatopsis sp. H20-H5 TaxID=3046309 RepID=UPI002DB951FF|nr:GNAT family N-acetyltransferase [Amycolatopsis sp. H20-H5]MEC3978112.1 GNAT family N-acetyltransferase [Amycolatopsis sp. H20-H5]